LKDECAHPGYYSDAIEYDFQVKTAECWLTCSNLHSYFEDKIPKYEEIIRTTDQQFGEEKRKQQEQQRLKELEQQKVAAEKADRLRRAKLRASKECKIAKKSGVVCQSYTVYQTLKERLKEEQEAGKVSGYVDKNILRNFEKAIQLAFGALRQNELAFKNVAGKQLDKTECDGWVRGANPSHPLQEKMDLQCGN